MVAIVVYSRQRENVSHRFVCYSRIIRKVRDEFYMNFLEELELEPRKNRLGFWHLFLFI